MKLDKNNITYRSVYDASDAVKKFSKGSPQELVKFVEERAKKRKESRGEE